MTSGLDVDLDGDRARNVAQSLPGTSIAVEADVAVEEDVDRYLDEATRSPSGGAGAWDFGGLDERTYGPRT